MKSYLHIRLVLLLVKMKHSRLLAALFLISLVHPCQAEGPDLEDIENVPTPAELMQLLPEGEADGVILDYWLAEERRRSSNDIKADDQPHPYYIAFKHYVIRREKGELVFEWGFLNPHSTNVDGEVTYVLEKVVFTKEGNFKSFEGFTRTNDRLRYEVSSEIKEDKLVITRLPIGEREKEKFKPHVTSVDLDDNLAATTRYWMPLIYAYHIRKESLGYRMKTRPYYTSSIRTFAIEDIGTEMVEHNGAQKKAHVLLTSEQYKRRGKMVDNRRSWKVLESGEVIYISMREPNLSEQSRSIQKEALMRRFGEQRFIQLTKPIE